MRTIVIGDIHGCYKELVTLINYLRKNKKYNPKKDKIIFLGDYIDRGENSRRVIKYIRGLQTENSNVIALLGNHEDMLLNYIKSGDLNWLNNGYSTTIKSYKGNSEDFFSDIEWMKQLPLYHEDKHYIYVHAGINKNLPIDKQNKDTLLWTREEFYNNPNKYYKPVIFGHTPTLFFENRRSPIFFDNNINIDTGCVFGGNLTALLIEKGKAKNFYSLNTDKNEVVKLDIIK